MHTRCLALHLSQIKISKMLILIGSDDGGDGHDDGGNSDIMVVMVVGVWMAM